MAGKKTSTVAPTPPAAPRAAVGSGANGRGEHVVSIDLERLSSADISLELATIVDLESQTQRAAAAAGGGAAGTELQTSVHGSSPTGGGSGSGTSSSSIQKTTGGSSLMSKWRWIGQKELQYLVTNRRTPRPRPEGSASTAELDRAPDSSASAAAPADAEKGAFVRVVTEGAGIPAALEGGSEGGRQRIAHILLPTTAESPERDQPGNPDQPPSQRSGELSAAAAAAAGGKKRKVSSAVGDANGRSPSQDLEKGKVNDQAMGAGGGGGRHAVEATANGFANGYHHDDDTDDDNNEPLCRVCHQSTSKADVISLGCACKLDLGRAHRGCAETWFQVRGNRQCEICGQIAQNVQLLEPMEDITISNPEPAAVTLTLSHPATICWQNRPIRNFLLVFLVAAFLIPWLFRFAYYRS